jgi:hypothetical protein
MSRRTPTIPSAPSWSASSSIRVIARWRALYIACESVSNSRLVVGPATWMPMWKIELPTTRPTGSKPASVTSRNSFTVRSEV